MHDDVPTGAAPYLDVLQRYHTDITPHSGRHLIDHLLGVYRLLDTWGNAPETCRAGLFHSIYGTNIFNVKSAPFTERESIRVAIGDVAERLAFLFCVTDRPVAFLAAAAERNYALADTVHNESIAITANELRALIEIEVANFCEQPEKPDDLRLIYNTIIAIERHGPLISSSARSALAASASKSTP
ncbi:MAG TPA: hypothetical protein VGG27_11085 [Magnetospirillaceae bacterium]|jgi:hypothetical protein